MMTGKAQPGAGLPIAMVGTATVPAWLQAGFEAVAPGCRISCLADAGAMSPEALAILAEAVATVIVTPAGVALSPDVRRAVLLAWGLGASPILAFDTGAGPLPVTGGDPAREFEALARGLSGATADWFELPRQAEALAACVAKRRDAAAASPLRHWIEAQGRDARGAYVTGRLVSGAAKVGLAVVAMPAAVAATVTSVERIEGTPTGSGSITRLGLDRALPAEGSVLLAAAEARPELADQVAAHLVWTGKNPLLPGRPYTLRLGTQTLTAQVSTLKHRLNPADLAPVAARRLGQGEIGLCNLSFSAPLLFDPAGQSPAMGRFALADPIGGETVGFGRIAFTLRRATNIHWQALSVDKGARASLKGQRPCCLWLTGLSGSGKSTVASLLEKRLNAAGRHTYTLDGDNVRHGLNRDLGFTDADRVENIRRVAEVAKLFVDSGLIVLVSFISPFRAERRMARDLLPGSEFLEIFVDTPIEICEQRDPKGLYKKARAGTLKNFTGIDSPYEPPEHAEILLKAGEATPEVLVDSLYRELERRGIV